MAIHLPTLNAVLNGTCAVLLFAGYVFIKKNNISAHRACMLGAFATSILFLTSYLYYHAHAGSKAFQGQGWIRPVYFTILISHTILAAAIVPMVITTLNRALKRNFKSHAKVARLTWPIWIYVSITGVVIYGMLYL